LVSAAHLSGDALLRNAFVAFRGHPSDFPISTDRDDDDAELPIKTGIWMREKD
jgi:hypothetical protein